MIQKKGTEKSKAKPRSGKAKKPPAKKTHSTQPLERELADALARENAAAGILRIIARVPGDLQAVVDALAERAARLCEAKDAQIFCLENDLIHRVADYGDLPVALEHMPYSRKSPAGRAMMDRRRVHIRDLAIVAGREFPIIKSHVRSIGLRTALAVPLLRDGISIGAILIRRLEVRPFTERQIKLLEIFADQAAIAIENVRAFQELQVRSRDLSEALEQQTAASEILRLIASSPTDLQPVMDFVAESAARLCAATGAVIQFVEGNSLRAVSHYGSIPRSGRALRISREWPAGRAVVDRQTLHIADVLAVVETEFPDARLLQRATGTRTLLVAPLIRAGVSIGTLLVRRTEVRPFTDKQIALLKTCADQTAIAIENAREYL